MSTGWIKLHRQLLDSDVWHNPRELKVWIWCLLHANHATGTVRFAGEAISIPPGSFIAGRFTGAEGCGLAPSTFWDIVKRLEKYGMLSMKSDNKKTLYTIAKWCDYQSTSNSSDSKPAAKRHKQDGENGRRKGAKNAPPAGVQLYREVSGRYPVRALFESVNTVLVGRTADEVRPYFLAWIARGHNPVAATWALEWVPGGRIPPQGAWKQARVNGSGSAGSTESHLPKITLETEPWRNG